MPPPKSDVNPASQASAQFWTGCSFLMMMLGIPSRQVGDLLGVKNHCADCGFPGCMMRLAALSVQGSAMTGRRRTTEMDSFRTEFYRDRWTGRPKTLGQKRPGRPKKRLFR